MKRIPEYILCSAVEYNGQIISGFRHNDCNDIIRSINPNYKPDRKNQGFLTSMNRFVDRKEAWRIAVANKQIKYGLIASDNGEDSSLVSENLYLDPEEQDDFNNYLSNSKKNGKSYI
jgi:hypothetical protein